MNKHSGHGKEPWPYNPLVTLIRYHGTEIITGSVDRYEAEHGFKASSFDLALQVMIVACSYKPRDVWLAENDDVTIAAELVSKGAANEAFEVLEHGIEHGQVRLNTDLIEAIAQDQLVRLHKIHSAHQREFDLPPHDGQALSYFSPGAELSALRLVKAHSHADLYEAVAVEKSSGEKVVFRPLDQTLSRAYIETFHYLHAAREDDSLAFGAFVEGEDFPFATVSYAPVSRAYKQKMLHASGIDPRQSLELTRAWNSDLSPKNTMSMLYGYAHVYIQRTRRGKSEALQAIITAVNPNLGFKGSAFRAVGFGVIGEKPTAYHYMVDDDDRRVFTLRRSMTKISRSSSNEFRFIAAATPLLPTKELAVILSGRKRSKPLTEIVYRVTEAEYRHELHRSAPHHQRSHHVAVATTTKEPSVDGIG